MNSDEIINKAISLIQGEKLPLGTVCAHPSDDIAYELKKYDGNNAVLILSDGIEKYFPASEIFDVNKAKRIAVSIKLGLIK